MTAGTSFLRDTGPSSPRARLRAISSSHRSGSVVIGMAIAGALLPVLSLLPPFANFTPFQSWLNSFANAGVFVLLALGLNVVVGMAGLLDLGYAAFFAFGAYTYAFAASPTYGTHFPFLLMLFVGAGVAALFGVLLGAPTLRLRGDYLAIMTLGFGEIVPIVFLNAQDLTQGTNGIGGIYRPDVPLLGTFGALNNWPYYLLMLGILTITMVLLYRLQDSRMGRAWAAIREDELAAAASGVNTVTTKLLAFAIGATTAGFAGVYQASKITLVSPNQFAFTVSFTVLAMVVLGGMGNIWGVAAGAFIIFIIQAVLLTQLNSFVEGLSFIPGIGPVLADIDFLRYQYVLYGVALVLMMLFRPEGLFPSQRVRRVLHTPEDPSLVAATEGSVDLVAEQELDEEAAIVELTHGVEGSLGNPPGADEDGADAPRDIRP